MSFWDSILSFFGLRAELAPQVEGTVTYAELRSAIKALMPYTTVELRDETYARPNPDWLQYGYYNWLLGFLSDFDLDYRKNFDCDNFSDEYYVQAQAAHGRNKSAASEVWP